MVMVMVMVMGIRQPDHVYGDGDAEEGTDGNYQGDDDAVIMMSQNHNLQCQRS